MPEPDVLFDDSKNSYQDRYEFAPVKKGLIGRVLDLGLVKTEAQAAIVLFVIAILLFLAAGIGFYMANPSALNTQRNNSLGPPVNPSL